MPRAYHQFSERYQAYKNCMKKFGLKIKESYIWDVNYSEKTIREEVGKYLSENNENPTYIIAENDLLHVMPFMECRIMVTGYQRIFL